ncbi:hypothetical protein CC86DRAFT_184177 [Ophiobolus disseminans]|uniref:F-box domain-containing protein n=1 Tax=Ophiobolus disseminans TaxID=1469910 RepID=A0A6A7A8J8_9PLEO|nr:hypothetical protein CC86DRAFT_184177 [Ophiobolus disseminans]
MRVWALPEVAANAASTLARSLAQYPVLEGLVSHLQPDDLVTLTTICQAVHTQIRMHEPQAKANLLSKTLCPGTGLVRRLLAHCPCKTRGWHRFLGCGSEGYDIASKPCVGCGINTCDECRIHIIYQVFMQEHGLDKHRWWAGFFLNNPTPFAIYPPKGGDNASWYLPPNLSKSHHDQGRIHIPLHIDSIADPEPIDRLLDVDLGRSHVVPAGRTEMPFEGHNLVLSFNLISQTRKEFLCLPCFEQHCTQGFQPCSCTFRKRFLERWLCTTCHNEESASNHRLLERFDIDEGDHIHSRSCRCGCATTPTDDYMTICNWCQGRVEHPRDHDEESDDEIGEEEEEASDDDDDDDDNEDENAAPMPEGLAPNHLALGENTDGTLTAFFNRKRISGERLCYALISQYAANHGADLGCSCCVCPGRGTELDHGHGDDEDNASEDDDDNVGESGCNQGDGDIVGDYGDYSDYGVGDGYDIEVDFDG